MTDASYRDYSDFDSGWYAPDEDFEGVLERHDNGQLLFRGKFAKGKKRVGQHVAYWDNGNLQEFSYWVDGWITGTQQVFHRDGTLEFERIFGVDGGRIRCWIECRYLQLELPDDYFSLSAVRLYENDEIVREWCNPDYSDLGAGDGVREAIKKFFPEIDFE